MPEEEKETEEKKGGGRGEIVLEVFWKG